MINYCTHKEKDVLIWYKTDGIDIMNRSLTREAMCAGCFKELARGGRVLIDDDAIKLWWKEASE